MGAPLAVHVGSLTEDCPPGDKFFAPAVSQVEGLTLGMPMVVDFSCLACLAIFATLEGPKKWQESQEIADEFYQTTYQPFCRSLYLDRNLVPLVRKFSDGSLVRNLRLCRSSDIRTIAVLLLLKSRLNRRLPKSFQTWKI